MMLSFLNTDIGITVGENGTILKTTDAGANWISQSSGTTSSLTSVYFTDADHGVVVGKNLNNYKGIILKTTDGGNSWNTQLSDINENLNSVFFIDQNNGIAVGANPFEPIYRGTILRTSDGGLTWIPQNMGVTNELLM